MSFLPAILLLLTAATDPTAPDVARTIGSGVSSADARTTEAPRCDLPGVPLPLRSRCVEFDEIDGLPAGQHGWSAVHASEASLDELHAHSLTSLKERGWRVYAQQFGRTTAGWTSRVQGSQGSGWVRIEAVELAGETRVTTRLVGPLAWVDRVATCRRGAQQGQLDVACGSPLLEGAAGRARQAVVTNPGRSRPVTQSSRPRIVIATSSGSGLPSYQGCPNGGGTRPRAEERETTAGDATWSRRSARPQPAVRTGRTADTPLSSDLTTPKPSSLEGTEDRARRARDARTRSASRSAEQRARSRDARQPRRPTAQRSRPSRSTETRSGPKRATTRSSGSRPTATPSRSAPKARTDLGSRR